MHKIKISENEWKNRSTHWHGLFLCPVSFRKVLIRKTRTTVFPSGSCSLKTRKEKEPQYRGVPSVVAQYHKSRDALYEGQFDDKMKNLQRGGEGIIAVSYEARARGIKRGETRYLRDAKKICPEVHAFVVEEKYGKACLNLYRDASRRGTRVISTFKRPHYS